MRKVLPTTGLPIGLALILAIPLTLLQPSVVYGDEDRASLGDWIYVSILFVATVVLMLVIVVASRRTVNPHTGLRSKIRRGTPRARGRRHR